MVVDPGWYKLKWYDKPIAWFIDVLFIWHRRSGTSVLPKHLKNRRHWDYIWPLLLIPRWVTSWDWGVPKMIWGDQIETRSIVVEYWEPKKHYWRFQKVEGPAPIGERGSWQVSRYPNGYNGMLFKTILRKLPIYFAFTTRSGIHFRIGARWDDVDDYVTFPVIAIKSGVR